MATTTYTADQDPLAVDVHQSRTLSVLRRLIELNIIGNDVGNLAPYLLVVTEADGGQAQLRLVDPADVVVFEADSTMAKIATDGVNLTVSEADGSPADIPLVAL